MKSIDFHMAHSAVCIYSYMCVCVSVCLSEHSHTHTCKMLFFLVIFLIVLCIFTIPSLWILTMGEGEYYAGIYYDMLPESRNIGFGQYRGIWHNARLKALCVNS
jgi:hypothetical protein